MAKLLYTDGTGALQTTTETHDEKVPIYGTYTDAENDLDNLSEGQLVATDGNDEALSYYASLENRIAELETRLANDNLMSDYEQITLSAGTNYTCQYDGIGQVYTYNNSDNMFITVNGVSVSGLNVTNSQFVYTPVTVKKGDRLSISAGSSRPAYFRWFKLRDYSNR